MLTSLIGRVTRASSVRLGRCALAWPGRDTLFPHGPRELGPLPVGAGHGHRASFLLVEWRVGPPGTWRTSRTLPVRILLHLGLYRAVDNKTSLLWPPAP